MQQLDYDAWGQVTLDTNPGWQPFGFAGGLYDPVTGLVRFGAQDYAAAVGRWTAPDARRFGGEDANLYVYSFNNPIFYVDRSGFQAEAAAPGPFDPLYDKWAREITYARNRLETLYNELLANKGDLPMTGKNSIEGHRQAFEQMRDRLRRRLNAFRDKPCGNKLPSDVFQWATVEAPYPQPKSPPEALREAVEDAFHWIHDNVRPPTQQEIDRIRAAIVTGAAATAAAAYAVCCL